MAKITTDFVGGETIATTKTRLETILDYWLGTSSTAGVSTWGDLRTLLNSVPSDVIIADGELASSFRPKINELNVDLLGRLLEGATQLIAHPLEYGSMFQDRAGTTPVTEAGQLVGHCLDAGGGDYHATAVSDAARGVFREAGGKRWIEYNGINTAYATPALPAPGVDKVQVFAGLRKLSDANFGMLLEFSPNININSGSLYVLAPRFEGSANYGFASKGSTPIVATSPSTYAAPITNILTGLGDISGDLSTLRIDGVQVDQSTGDQGTGNYNPSGTYPLYYGAREGTSLFFDGNHYDTLGPITRFSATNATAAQIEAAEAYYTARVV